MTKSLLIGLAAFLGSMASGTIGWVNSCEPFILRKFIGNVTRAVIAGVSGMIGSDALPALSGPVLAMAFLGGVGVDHGVQSVSSIVQGMPAKPNGPKPPQP